MLPCRAMQALTNLLDSKRRKGDTITREELTALRASLPSVCRKPVMDTVAVGFTLSKIYAVQAIAAVVRQWLDEQGIEVTPEQCRALAEALGEEVFS